jgi:glycerol-3-phosphate acyltransferase PlsX
VVKSLYAKHDYHEYGGAPLLGVNGVCLISHGSSQARTIMNAIVRMRQFVITGLNGQISQRLGELRGVGADAEVNA